VIAGAVVLSTVVLLGSGALTWVVRNRALARGMLDRPNARSSHSVPTPRGGGLAIVIVVTIAVLGFWSTSIMDTPLMLALVGGGAAVALIGFCDDRGSLPVLARIAVHIASAVWAIAILGGVGAVQWGDRQIDPGLITDVFAVLGIVWMLNLFNFMDGIDGIAGSEAVFLGAAGAALVSASASSGAVSATGLVVGAASLGFLRWNWPPARVFMGDVGSGYLGYIFAVLALAATRENPVMPFVWLILGGAFFVDATITLLRRLARGERIFEAHRTHAYQWLARRWQSHRKVTLLVWMINLFWILPWAWLAQMRPSYAGWIALAALGPLAIGALWSGAGRSESRSGT